jgi:hypothetical protein
MTRTHSTGALVCLLVGSTLLGAQQPALPPPEPGMTPFIVFVASRPIGREDVSITRDADGWTVRGTSRLGPPLDITTRRAEVRYDGEWRAKSLNVDSIVRGEDVALTTTFADGKATSEISVQGKPTPKVDAVSADAVVLPNTFLGSYAALARRLVGRAAGSELRAYIAPQVEIPMRIRGLTPERIDAPQASIEATRVSLALQNPPPLSELEINVWIDPQGQLLRLNLPAQSVELAREDIASAATRTTAFTVPGDAPVHIPALGFNLAGTATTPPRAKGPHPVVVLIGGSGPTDRDETVAGIPVFGQVARDLSAAGFLVVRYDKRGVGQSGGRAESVTLNDYAEDARAVVRWAEKLEGADKKRIALVGHSEGASVAMLLGARENDRVKAIALMAGVGTTGAELILEQQRHALDRMKLQDPQRAERIALQERIQANVIKGAGADWTGVPDSVRKAADTPWFHSFLTFDPARVMRDVRQPILIVQGELDTQVPSHHADRLADLARTRKRQADVQVLKVPGVNHLLVPAKTGEVDEYRSLGGPNATVSTEVTGGVAQWLKKTLAQVK